MQGADFDLSFLGRLISFEDASRPSFHFGFRRRSLFLRRVHHLRSDRHPPWYGTVADHSFLTAAVRDPLPPPDRTCFPFFRRAAVVVLRSSPPPTGGPSF